MVSHPDIPDLPSPAWLDRPWVVAGLLGLVVLALTAPSQPWSRALGHPTSDLADHVQGMWWFGGEIQRGRWPSFSAITHAPEGTALWFVDPVGGLLSVLIRPLGPLLSFNGVVLLQLWAAGLASWAMCKDLGASSAGALLAGVFLCTSPYLLGLVHSGITEGLGLTPVVLLCWAVLRSMGRGGSPPRLGFLWAGLALSWVGLQSPVYLAGGLVLCGLSALGPLRQLPQRLATLGGIFAIATGPMLWLRRSVQSTLGENNQVAGSWAPGWQPEGLPATDLLGFFRPGAHYFPDTPALGNPGVLHVHYLGWVALGCAALGWRRAPWLRLPAIGVGLMCLGPSLAWNGEHIPSLDSPLLLPLSLFYLDGSPLSFVHHPYRLVALALPVLAVLLSLGVSKLRTGWVGALGLGIVLEALLLSPAPWPLASTGVATPEVYANLPDGPVMDWPPDGTTWNRRYQLWQTVHSRPIAYGVNTTFPEAARHDPVLWSAFARLTDPMAQLKNRDIPGRLPRLSTQRASLVEQGFTALVFHAEALEPGDRRRTLNALHQAYGPPESREGGAYGWSLQSEAPAQPQRTQSVR
jgi:hypothetical protein